MTRLSFRSFQSTLPRRERRRLSRIRTGGGTISIHAPAKGATIQPFWTAERSPVFQSTLPRRERRDIPTPKVTPRHEISIHAPAKGATPLASEVKQHFNPRSREGSDVCPADIRQAIAEFQSTLPRRERRVSARAPSASQRFQSTLPRRERPALDSYTPPVITISIHAPAKGATSRWI